VDREEELQGLVDSAEAGIADAMEVFEMAELSYVAAAQATADRPPPIQTGTTTSAE